MTHVKPLTAACLMLALAPIALSQANQTDCKSLVLQNGSPETRELQPQKGEKYRRPPMVAYEVQEDGGVSRLRLVRRSGIKELDQELVAAASKWNYKERPGCGTARVPLAAGPVPNQNTALKVAEPELIRIYGASVIGSEKPLIAGLSGDMWIVSGTLTLPPTTSRCSSR
jgi:TonB family protein